MSTKYLIGNHDDRPNRFVFSHFGLTVDPHSYFQKSMRKHWRRMEEWHPDQEWRETQGLMYAIWALPDAPAWNVPDAIAWAKQHMAQAEVHVITGPEVWATVKVAVHPDNPITFE